MSETIPIGEVFESVGDRVERAIVSMQALEADLMYRGMPKDEQRRWLPKVMTAVWQLTEMELELKRATMRGGPVMAMTAMEWEEETDAT